MAESPSHQFGQVIGDILEAAVKPVLQEFADKYNLYLDKQGPRPTRDGNKVSWVDKNGNKHDLDFVLERSGTPRIVGTPVAFIETAWRRYTKHSRNKAQEIQGAIMPLVETYGTSPFIGAVLAGEFTEGALSQLDSLGFAIAYFPYKTVLEAFSTVGIDASSDERTADSEFAKRMRRWNNLADSDKQKVGRLLLRLNARQMGNFMGRLEKTINRQVKTVRILPLHGEPKEWKNVGDAIKFISNYKEDSPSSEFCRYEVTILYMNGNRITGEFQNKKEAIQFLETNQGT
ncbi:MAG: DNA methylase [Acidobacteria bacterium]|nr:MAG: DNA methylase [Acidobacteriota bacterium]